MPNEQVKREDEVTAVSLYAMLAYDISDFIDALGKTNEASLIILFEMCISGRGSDIELDEVGANLVKGLLPNSYLKRTDQGKAHTEKVLPFCEIDMQAVIDVAAQEVYEKNGVRNARRRAELGLLPLVGLPPYDALAEHDKQYWTEIILDSYHSLLERLVNNEEDK